MSRVEKIPTLVSVSDNDPSPMETSVAGCGAAVFDARDRSQLIVIAYVSGLVTPGTS
jgi:hypothetical protein